MPEPEVTWPVVNLMRILAPHSQDTYLTAIESFLAHLGKASLAVWVGSPLCNAEQFAQSDTV